MEEIVSYAVMMMMMLLWGVTLAAGGFPTTMQLQRLSVPATHSSDLSHVLARDRARHGRLLQRYGIHIPVQKNLDQYGTFYTRIQIGSPPMDFYVMIDTVSDISWISCNSCSGCPNISNVPIQLSFYNPLSSATSSLISCWDHRCKIAVGPSQPGCLTSQCSYKVSYDDGSTTSGFFVSDLLHLNANNTSEILYSTPVLFGCSNTRVEESFDTVDGIFGFGPSANSIISQLASAGMTPKIFAHCFKGGNVGDGPDGSLVLGEVSNPDIVYTPLIPSEAFYSVNLESISVNNQLLDIDPFVFVKSIAQGAIVDSGSALAYLPEAAYVPLTTTMATIVSQFAKPYILGNVHCYLIDSSVSVDDLFPWVSFNFANSASLILNPKDYLTQLSSDNPAKWCLGFFKSQHRDITVLGDIIMKDKIIIYDMEAQRMGWVNHDCSLPVNVSEFHGASSHRSKSLSLTLRLLLILSSIIAVLCTIVVVGLLLKKCKEILRRTYIRFWT